MAASLAAAKLHMPLCHAEAGFRTHCRTNPEEVNRICTDHLASLNFAPTPQSIDNLIAEGLGEVSSFTGDLMYDAFQHARSNAGYKKVTLAKFDGAEIVVPTRYVYLTCHREENDSDATLCEVVTAANRFDVPVIYPVHPRVRDKVSRLVEELSANNVLLVRPVGYFESVSLTAGADLVFTDSGGLQREAFYAQVKCVTLLPFPSADETLRDDRNTLVSQVTAEKILEAARVEQTVNPSYRPFGQGDAAEKMVERIVEFFERGE